MTDTYEGPMPTFAGPRKPLPVHEPRAMLRSMEMKEIATALAAAQGAFPDIPKNCVMTIRDQHRDGTPYEVTYRYAGLDAITKATRPALAENGLSHTCWIGDRKMTTVLMHSSGQYCAVETPLVYDERDAFAHNGEVTKKRRVVLQSLLGVCGDGDIEGNDSVDRTPPPAPTADTGTRTTSTPGAGRDERSKCLAAVTEWGVRGENMKKVLPAIMHACGVKAGKTDGGPAKLPPAAWRTMREYVESLASAGGTPFDAWAKNLGLSIDTSEGDGVA